MVVQPDPANSDSQSTVVDVDRSSSVVNPSADLESASASVSPIPHPVIDTEGDDQNNLSIKIRKRDYGFLPIPKNRRHDPHKKVDEEFGFTWKMNLVFAFAATVSVMNLYYIQPMLVAIASDFSVSHSRISSIPTLVQGGYGTGIIFISPLGDLVRRRQLVLLLILLTTILSIGLALAPSVAVLEGISFIVGMLTVTPQICIPWTADLAPANKRATAMSITLSGLIFGLVLGRVLGGILSRFGSWRDTYWLAVGLQGCMTVILYFTLPDTPDKKIGLSYFGVLWSMAKFFTMYPTLVQACLVSFFSSAVFAGFWTSLTFVLNNSPYHYNSFEIGLFGLLGLIGAILAPQWGRLVDRTHPYLGQISGISINMISMVVALVGADKNISAVCIAIVGYDMGQQLAQVSSSYRIAGLDPKARARLNGCSLLAVFAGQTSGTAILTHIYNTHGWKPTGGTAVAFIGAALVVLFIRGPHEIGWIGWHGGGQILKKEKMTDLSPEAITEKLRVKKKETEKEKGGGQQV
ncbi:membrane protein [Kwoniella mangroviensis CBS 10435]|uniref:Membrane protein n=1 Tax=Kwoniella mangroviensis CBS 10435 TaxID=1331196 RepID=A0A1B9IK62_9TREE|nr:membrane protein [Kwoniella mangroviensis CBS 10435]OCF71752.1 membrane protein [Kwoniella mangroviensis CBS 8886]